MAQLVALQGQIFPKGKFAANVCEPCHHGSSRGGPQIRICFRKRLMEPNTATADDSKQISCFSSLMNDAAFLIGNAAVCQCVVVIASQDHHVRSGDSIASLPEGAFCLCKSICLQIAIRFLWSLIKAYEALHLWTQIQKTRHIFSEIHRVFSFFQNCPLEYRSIVFPFRFLFAF